MATPSSACHSTVLPCFHGSLGFLHSIPDCGFPPSHPLRLSSHSQQQSSSPGLLSNPHAPASSPCAHQQKHVPVPGMQGGGTDHLCPVCHKLAFSHSSHCPRWFSSVLTNFLIGKRVFPDAGTSPLLQLPSRGAGPIPLPLLFFLPSFFHSTWLCRGLYCPFWCPRSSASVQLLFCENCSICRCILGASMERDELHIFLLLHHLENLCFQYLTNKSQQRLERITKSACSSPSTCQLQTSEQNPLI